MKLLALMLSAVLLTYACAAHAKEGLFPIQQWPVIASDLRASGLTTFPDSLTDFPTEAIVDLENCSGALVSKQGLVVTNHYCVSGTLQYHSQLNNNYLESGFLANSFSQELPAAPETRILITTEFSDVTLQVLDGVLGLNDRQRIEKIDQNIKNLIAQCEQDQGFRCKVPVFNEGLQYTLIKQFEINDVRLVYAPQKAVGGFGGEVDNWEWPRHTGDFAFYRAYVDSQGRGASYSKNNVPYVPKHVLKVSAKPLKEGDFVMALGFPNSTQRYARAEELDYLFNWLYPMYVQLVPEWIEVIERNAERGSEARLKYEYHLAALHKFLKSTQGQLAGARRTNLVQQRKTEEALLGEWLVNNENANASRSIEELDNIKQQQMQIKKQQVLYRNATRSALLDMAKTLYKHAVEQQKPDNEREFGYQTRDKDRLFQQIMQFDRRVDIAVDKTQWAFLIEHYQRFPQALRINAFDQALASSGPQYLSISAKLDDFYKRTQLLNVDARLALFNARPEQFENSEDPFIKLAIVLHNIDVRLKQRQDILSGQALTLQTAYMQAVSDWKSSQGKVMYPDANGTLRVSYGEVKGGSPKDGLIYEPFTRVEGVVEKHTGRAPFNAPEKQITLIKNKNYGDYADPMLETVPVNFLSDVDSTGGSSGSATLNREKELVGLLFDSTVDSVNADWGFDERTTRAIHVDSRYMLWVMEYLDNATRLIDEMDIVRETATQAFYEERNSASEQ